MTLNSQIILEKYLFLIGLLRSKASNIFHNRFKFSIHKIFFIGKYNKLWNLILDLYTVWIEPASIKELTSQTLINVSEVYDAEITKGSFTNTTTLTNSTGAAVIIMLNSFLNIFNVILGRLSLIQTINEKVESNDLCMRLHENARNYVLNKFLHFYYETIASVLTSKIFFFQNIL